jgi:hypothetical protein
MLGRDFLRHTAPRAIGSRPVRLAIGAIAAVVVLLVLVAPVVLRSSGGSAKPCARALHYEGRQYLARPVAPGRLVEAIAIGVGVTSGCGASPANVDLRSIAGVEPTLAVALAADSSAIYVRPGVCAASTATTLVGCLHRLR